MTSQTQEYKLPSAITSQCEDLQNLIIRLTLSRDAYNQLAAEIVMQAIRLQLMVLEETTLYRAEDTGDFSRVV